MGRQLLISEDEALIALSLADCLEAEGFDVTLACDGAEALATARQMGSALGTLVTDLNMPRLPGEDLIRALRAERPGLPVVVLTGSAPPGGVQALRRHGGGHGPLLLLHKAVDFTHVVQAVRGVAAEAGSGDRARSVGTASWGWTSERQTISPGGLRKSTGAGGKMIRKSYVRNYLCCTDGRKAASREKHLMGRS